MKKLLSLLFLASLLAACAKQYKPADFPGAKLAFGSGGGYTGGVKTYVLLENGQLFSSEYPPDTSFHEAGRRLDKKMAKQIFTNYEFLGLADVKHQKPGNIYNFIEYQKGGEKHRLVWSGSDPDLPASVKIFYQNINQLTKEARSKD